MERYFKKFILFIIPLFIIFIDYDVSALNFDTVSNRVTYKYMDGTYIDKDFYPDNTWILPQYANIVSGEPYFKLYQFRYTLNSKFLKTRTYTLKINWLIRDFNDGNGTIDLSEYRNALPLQNFGCGTNYSNTTPDNITVISNDFTYSNTDGTVEWNIKFKPKVDTCTFLSGIFYHDDDNSYYAIINNNITNDTNSRLIITPSYTYVESADNSDIIANNNQNTQQIIDNNNSNTQDIIDSQDKINDSLNDDNVDSDVGTGFFDNFNNEDFGLSEIITIPLDTITSLTSKSCQPLSIPIPKTGKNINLPCMTQVYQDKIPSVFSIWQIVSFGIIAYFVAIDIFHMVKGFKDPESDKVEVLDL